MSPNDLPQYLAPTFENPAHLHWANGTLGLELCVHTRGSAAAQNQGKEAEGRHLPPDRAGPAGGATLPQRTSLPGWISAGLGAGPTQLRVVSLEKEGADEIVKDLETPLK